MEDIKALIRFVLEQGFTMSLGTVDKDGVWVSDVTYIHDSDFNIYWLSRTNLRHSEAIISNPNVSGAITLGDNPEKKVIGIQISGVAEKIKGEFQEIAVKREIKAGEARQAVSDGILYPNVSWYRLRPKRIELMHVPLFGFEKKILNL